MENNKTNVRNPNYSLTTAKNFFGGTDYTRIVIIVYIFLSFILNIIFFTVAGIKQCKKKENKFSLGILVTCILLLVNFIHTFSYFFEWVIKKGIDIYKIKKKDGTVESKVGGLLIGNPNNFFCCYAQAFLLISSSISQDIIINIFFYMIYLGNEKTQLNLKKIICLLIFGIIFPIGFTLGYYFIGALGLNDEFCYVKKFEFKFLYEDEKKTVKYEKYEGFQLWVMIVYSIRVINFFITFYFLINIIKYIKQEKESRTYILKTIIIPLIQLFTIFIGVLYRVLNIFSPKASEEIAWVYLVLNTSDGVLFPLLFLFLNHIFSSIKGYFSSHNLEYSENETLINDYDDD